MRYSGFIIILFILSAYFSNSIAQPNQWQNLGQNGGSPICISIIPETDEILIGTFYRGIYRANLNNPQWSPSHRGILDTVSKYEVVDIQSIPNNPGEYLVGIWSWFGPLQYYLYHSADYGNNWDTVCCYPSNINSGTMAFWIDPINNQHWIWAGFTSALWHTFDGGLNWSYINQEDNPGVKKFYSPPGYDNVVFNLSLAGARPDPDMGGIERSDDSGLNWYSVWNIDSSIVVQPYDITVDPLNNQHLIVISYVTSAEYSIYQWLDSYDGGMNWQPRIIDFPLTSTCKIAFDPTNPAIIYLGTIEQGLFKSIDNGQTWFNISEGICRGRPVIVLKVDASGTVYTSIEPFGLYRSFDGGENWEDLTASFPGGYPNSFLDREVEDDQLLTGTAFLYLWQNGVWNRIDQGIPWDAGLYLSGIFDPLGSERIYVGTEYFNNGLPNLWFTDNEGLDWYAIAGQPSNIDDIYFIDKTFVNDPRIFVKVDSARLWLYDISANQWEEITPPNMPYYYSKDPKASSIVPGLFYYSGGNCAFRSDNWGSDWEALNLPQIEIYNYELFPDPVDSDWVWAGRPANYPLLKSYDRGESWEICNSFYFNPANSLLSFGRFIEYPNIVIVGLTYPYSTFISYDSGDNWGAFNEGLNYTTFFDYMKCDPEEDSIIWAATADGIKKLEWNGSGITENNYLPNCSEIIGAYPNPFNNKVTLNYYLSQKTNISVVIYDILGREIKVLYEGMKEQGELRLEWDGNNMSGTPVCSGVYFVIFEAGNMKEVEKLVMIR